MIKAPAFFSLMKLVRYGVSQLLQNNRGTKLLRSSRSGLRWIKRHQRFLRNIKQCNMETRNETKSNVKLCQFTQELHIRWIKRFRRRCFSVDAFCSYIFYLPCFSSHRDQKILHGNFTILFTQKYKETKEEHRNVQTCLQTKTIYDYRRFIRVVSETKNVGCS